MKTQPARTPFPFPSSARVVQSLLGAAVLGGVAVLTLVLTSGGSERAVTSPSANAVGPGFAVERDAALVAGYLQGSAQPERAGGAAAGPAPMSVYIVASGAQAQSVQLALEEANLASVYDDGAVAFPYEVTMGPVGADAPALLSSNEVVPAFQSGIPSLEVVDLR